MRTATTTAANQTSSGSMPPEPLESRYAPISNTPIATGPITPNQADIYVIHIKPHERGHGLRSWTLAFEMSSLTNIA